jgi:cell division septal protein FtsQ
MSKARTADKAAAATKKNPGKGRRIVALLLIAASIGGAGFGIWKYVEPQIFTGSHYTFDGRQISVSAPPAWIRTDIKSEVLQSASLDGPLSVLDPLLAERLAKAFALHPWVAQVVRVTKRPAGADVELVYRKPVCMVEVPGGLYPVDAEGVLLPSSDFSPLEARAYPRLSGILTVTEGPVGTAWQDARVLGAAKIAAVLLDAWEELKLNRLAPATSGARPLSTTEPAYDIFTKAGTRILWGHPPGAELPDEPAPPEKLARLRKYAALRGGLDGALSPEDIDVRQPNDLVSIPRPADQTQK